MNSDSSSWRNKIQQIINDRENGSTYLLDNLLFLLRTAKYTDSDLSWSKSVLSAIDPSMAVIHHFLKELESIDSVTQVLPLVIEYENRYEAIPRNLLTNLTSQFEINGKTVLTLSNSKTIQDILCMACIDRQFKVFQTLSGPEEEGRIQFSRLKECNVSVEILQDDHVGQFMNRMDACFMGVDQYDKNHWVNKKGSAEITRLAIVQKIPVIVLADSRKYVKTIKAQSPLFEAVPFQPGVQLIEG